MLKLQGIPASSGVAIGPVFVLDDAGLHPPQRNVAPQAAAAEGVRLARAFEEVAGELRERGDAVAAELGEKYGAIFSAQAQMVSDPALAEEVLRLIDREHLTAEFAVAKVLRRFAQVFASLENEHLGQRSHDIRDIEQRLLRRLLGLRRGELSSVTAPVIVIARHMTPSETAGLPRRFVLGLVAESGGAGSHTAILAEGMAVPAVLGVGPLLDQLADGDIAIIDGDEGEVVVHPDAETLEKYEARRKRRLSQVEALESLRDLPAETRDGCQVELLSNIEFPQEADLCLQHGAAGIGLYRTEFLYLERGRAPSEEDHFRAYSHVLEKMGDRPVVIRTMDLGADKSPDLANAGETGVSEVGSNPALGLRSIRLALRNLPLFRTQLRAILRASSLGDVRLMFPLVTTLLELRQAKMILAEVMEDLEEQNLPFNRAIPIGMMVETPSAAILADRFAREVDFLSIGTNDLIQYALAADRSNQAVAHLYTASDPAVLQLIGSVTSVAEAAGKPVTLCGQMSGSPVYTMLLLGVGLRRLSVPSSALAGVKRVCRRVTISQCRETAARAMELDHARDVKQFLRNEMRQVLGEDLDS